MSDMPFLEVDGASRSQLSMFLLTYPQCAFDLDFMWNHIAAALKRKGVDLKNVQAVGCAEKHQNGDPHRHFFICLSKRLSLMPSDLAGRGIFGIVLEGYERRANVLKCHNKRGSINYVIGGGNSKKPLNEDIFVYPEKDQETGGYWFEDTSKKRMKDDEVVGRIMEGETMKDLLMADPVYVFKNAKKLLSFFAIANSIPTGVNYQMQDIFREAELCMMESMPRDDFLIASKVWDAFAQGAQDVVAGRIPRHIYLWGRSGIGKSTFVQMLTALVGPPYQMPCAKHGLDTIWWSPNNSLHTWAISDEYRGLVSIQEENLFMDGTPPGQKTGPLSLNVKGGSTEPCVGRKLCVFMSNLTPNQARAGVPDMLESWNRRFRKRGIEVVEEQTGYEVNELIMKCLMLNLKKFMDSKGVGMPEGFPTLAGKLVLVEDSETSTEVVPATQEMPRQYGPDESPNFINIFPIPEVPSQNVRDQLDPQEMQLMEIRAELFSQSSTLE